MGVTLNIQMPDELKEAIREEARRSGQSMSAWVREKLTEEAQKPD